MTLREAIARGAALLPAANRAGRFNVNWEPREAERRESQIEMFWGTRTPPDPSHFDLDGIRQRVCEHWKRSGALGTIPRKDRRYLATVMFFPPGAEAEWLAADRRFCAAVLGEVAKSSSAIKSFARALLIKYPAQLPTFRLLLSGFARLLEADQRRMSAIWQQRHRTFGLFSDSGPGQVAEFLLDEDLALAEAMEKVGLTGEYQVGEFSREVFLRVLNGLNTMLIDRPGAPALERPLECLLGANGSLRFTDLSGAVADAILLPHAKTEPLPATKARLQQFLLTHLKDPRMFRARWNGASKGTEGIFLRWLVSGTLEAFFELIGKNAWMDHWEYRRAFWQAYVRNNFVDDAWVVLGEEAYRIARTQLKNVSMTSGRLNGGQKTHSVLLMKIDSLTIAEWSHDGACRVWADSNPGRPELHATHYDRERDLMTNPDHWQAHHHSESYSWQERLAKYIRNATGRFVNPSEYQLRRRPR